MGRDAWGWDMKCTSLLSAGLQVSRVCTHNWLIQRRLRLHVLNIALVWLREGWNLPSCDHAQAGNTECKVVPRFNFLLKLVKHTVLMPVIVDEIKIIEMKFCTCSYIDDYFLNQASQEGSGPRIALFMYQFHSIIQHCYRYRQLLCYNFWTAQARHRRWT